MLFLNCILFCLIVLFVVCFECPAYCDCDSSSIECNEKNEKVSCLYSDLKTKLEITCIGDNSSGLDLLPDGFVNKTTSTLMILDCALSHNQTLANLMEYSSSIEFIKLRLNKSKDLEPYLFQNLSGLMKIEIESSDNNEFENDLLSYVLQLEELKLYANYSININGFMFNSLRHFKRLTVSQIYANYKIEFNMTSISKLNLKYFKCNGCDLTESIEITSAFKELQTLELTNCGIANFTKSFFKDSKNIDAINLSHNKIMLLNDNSFDAQKYLTTLDLSNNQIQIISRSSIFNIESLRILKMSHNAIAEIDK